MSKVRDGNKETELGVIPKEWKICDLEEICEFLDDKRKPIKAQDRLLIQGEIPYYGASGIIDWINDYIFDDQIILLGEDGENIKSRNLPLAFIVKGKCWVNNHAHVLKVINNNYDDIDYITYALEYKDYSNYIIGSAQPKLNQAVCRKIPLARPPMEEQQGISLILSTIDVQIENVDKLIEKTKELKKGLMQSLLTKGIGHEKYKDTEVGRIPEEWEVKKLEEICDFLDGLRKPIKAEDRAEMRGNIPYYGASGIIDSVNDYIFDDEIILLGEDGENIRSRNLPLAFKVKGKCWVNNHVHVLKAKDEHDSDFITYILENKDYSSYIIGSAQPKLNQAQCRKFLIQLPTHVEQREIASILLSVDELIDQYEAEKEKLQLLKNGLMQKLLTGEIRVKV